MFFLIVKIIYALIAFGVVGGVLWGCLKLFGYSLKFSRVFLYTFVFCIGGVFVSWGLESLLKEVFPNAVKSGLPIFVGMVVTYWVWKFLLYRDFQIRWAKALGFYVAVIFISGLLVRLVGILGAALLEAMS